VGDSPGQIITLTDDTFDTIIGSAQGIAIVDFWSEWCAPCLALEPVLEQLSAECATALIGRLNILQQPHVVERLGVKSVPTLIIFQNGLPVKRLFGAKGKRQILEALREFA
jgi:thioredoxin 1